MRISDWSSDVCSSDLSSLDRFALTWQRIGYRQGAIRPTERRSAVPDRPAPGRAVGWGTRGNIPCPNGAIALRGVAPFLLNPTAERKHGPSTYLEAGNPRERHWLAFGAQGLHVAAAGRAGYRHRVSSHRSRTGRGRSEEPTSEPKSLMRISYAVFCLK